MGRQPYIPLYIGDWEQDTNCLSLEAEGAALKLTFKLWKGNTDFGKGLLAISFRALSILFKTSPEKTKEIWNELAENKIFDHEIQPNGDLLIKSRRMIREVKISQIRSEIGKEGVKAKKVKQTVSKPQAKRKQITEYEYESDNEIVIDIEKGVQGEKPVIAEIPTTAEDWHLTEVNQAIENSFTPAYIKRLKTEGFEAFPGIDFDLQLKQFKLKVRGSPSKYSNHGLGLRQAFELQIRNAKPTPNNGTNHSNRKQDQLNDLLADHIATYGGPSSG